MSQNKATYNEILIHSKQYSIPTIPWEDCNPGKLSNEHVDTNIKNVCVINGIKRNADFKRDKMMLTEEVGSEDRERILMRIHQQIIAMGRLKNCLHIVQLLGISFDNLDPVLIIEYADERSLQDYLISSGSDLTWKTKLKLSYEIAIGLEATHMAGIVHGSLNGSSVLISPRNSQIPQAKLSGFQYCSMDPSIKERQIDEHAVQFCARECFDPELEDWCGRSELDLYSYGLVVWQIVKGGEIPFKNVTISKMIKLKKNGDDIDILLDELSDNTPQIFSRLIAKTIKNIPLERMSLGVIKNIIKKSDLGDDFHSHEEEIILKKRSYHASRNSDSTSLSTEELKEMLIPPSIKEVLFLEYKELANSAINTQYILGWCLSEGFGTEKDPTKAFEWFLKAAEVNHLIAQLSVGNCYAYGRGVKKDRTSAVHWWKKAAMAGSAEAQFNLGLSYHEGSGTEKDPVQAIEWWTKAAKAGHTDAQFNLGNSYSTGSGVIKNSDDAVKWWKKAAEAGHIAALSQLVHLHNEDLSNNKNSIIGDQHFKMIDTWRIAAEAGQAQGLFCLGCCYKSGFGIKRNPSEAVKLWEKAAEALHSISQYMLGNCYEQGDGVECDFNMAVKWWEMAAESGLPEAQFKLGNSYSEGFGIEKDIKKAFKWWEESAKAGYAPAQYNLGNHYNMRLSTRENSSKVVQYWREAAEAGHIEAQFNLGYFYDIGSGKRDPIESIKWWRKAAEAGHTQAQLNIGNFYDVGSGVERNPTKAIEWWTNAAEAGLAEAQFNLWNVYSVGSGTKKDSTKAIQWLKRSAEAGSPQAQLKLGDSYSKGFGVEKDSIKAAQWWKKAAETGIPQAQYRLGVLYSTGINQDDAIAFQWLKKAAEAGHGEAQIKLASFYVKEGDIINAIKWWIKATYLGLWSLACIILIFSILLYFAPRSNNTIQKKVETPWYNYLVKKAQPQQSQGRNKWPWR